jgi:hypoxanthine phosphoribosyltransferase
LPTQVGIEGELKPVVTAEQITRRIREMARQIQKDYVGQRLHLIAVLDNSYVFLSDLSRELDLPILCDFIRPQITHDGHATEIFFAPEPNVHGAHVLLIRGLVHSGVTTEFLSRTLLAQGAASVKVATLLDRPAGHRVALQPDYFGFIVSENFVCGYGIAGPGGLGRNLPYVASLPETSAPASP